MIKIQQLSSTSINTIYKAFEKAFEDYEEPFDMTVEQLQYMIERRGFNGNLSFGAFAGKELVGFTLNGIGKWNNELTAYDTGTGIIKEYRKQGIATRIFEESLPVLKQHQVNQYLLEVIKTNTKAFDLYKKAGFEVQREFDYWVSPIDLLNIKSENGNSEFSIKELNKADWDLFGTFQDFNPSWQNSNDAINRKLSSFKIAGVFHTETMIGYGIIEKHTGDIPQFAIAKSYRIRDLGNLLFDWFTKNTESTNLKIINTNFSDDGIKLFMKSLNFKAGFGQYEMLLKF